MGMGREILEKINSRLVNIVYFCGGRGRSDVRLLHNICAQVRIRVYMFMIHAIYYLSRNGLVREV